VGVLESHGCGAARDSNGSPDHGAREHWHRADGSADTSSEAARDVAPGIFGRIAGSQLAGPLRIKRKEKASRSDRN